MAGDWMKIELELPDKPEVHSMAGILNLDPLLIVGALIKVWGWFDKHTVDGNAFGVTYSLPDRITGVNGFGEAMFFVGWLQQNEKTLTMPNFDRHNSKSAKTRALTAKRVDKIRNADVTLSALPREEKRRSIYTPEFERFWRAYPANRKESKKNCAEKWEKKKLDNMVDFIIADVQSKISGWGEFNPAPLTYINQERWLDGQAEQKTRGLIV